jgi:protein O-mannosyl-transferase
MKRNKKNKQTEYVSANKNRSLVFLLSLVLVPFVLYFRVISYNFSTFDDTNLITDNFNNIGNIENLPKAFTTDAYFSHLSNFYRPVQTLSFMIDAQISGLNPWAYHLTNIIFIILITIAFFILLKMLRIRQEIALLLSLLYSVHPMLTSAVCWIPAQGDLFLTFFGLMSFILFIKYFDSKEPKYLTFHFICFLLACFSKETALVFPLLFLIYFYVILKKENPWKTLLPLIALWSVSFLIYFFFRHIAITSGIPSSRSGIIPFIKNLPAIPVTFGKIFFPFGLTTMPLFNILSVLCGILVFIFFIWFIVKYRIYQNPYILWGTVWFLGFTLPPMFFRFTIAQFSAEYFEHRTLLPMIGIFIMIGIFLNALLSKWSSSQISKLLIPVIIFYAVVSFIYSKDYSDSMTFYTSAIESNSNNAAALNSRGVELSQIGNLQNAIDDFLKAIHIASNYSSPYYNIAGVYDAQGDELKAEYYYSQALKYDTLSLNSNNLTENAYVNLSNIKIKLKKFNEDILLLKKGIINFPTNSDLFNNLGFIYYSTAKYDSAVFAFSKAIEFKPNTASYYTNRGLSKFSIKDYNGALSDFTKVLSLDTSSAGCWYNSGNAKIELKDYEGAILDFSSALKINPRWGEAYFRRGVAYSKLNRHNEAQDDWAEALKLGFRDSVNGK